MEYNINGSKIIVIRKSEEKGLTLLEGIVNSFIITANQSRGEKKNEKSISSKQK